MRLIENIKGEKMKEYDLVVATSSVNRPDHHSIVFPNYLYLLEGLNCYWYVNIDCISGGSSLENTMDNYKRMFDKFPNIEYEFSYINIGKTSTITEDDIKINPHIPTYPEGTGLAGTYEGWYKSCQYLFEQSIKPKSKYGIFWLEDDWGVPGSKLTGGDPSNNQSLHTSIHTKLKDIFDITDFGVMDYLPLTSQNGVSFGPGVFGLGLVEQYVLPHLNDKTNDRWMRSPERAVTNNPMPSRNIYHQYSYFYEIGREWSDKNVGQNKRVGEDGIRTFNAHDYYANNQLTISTHTGEYAITEKNV